MGNRFISGPILGSFGNNLFPIKNHIPNKFCLALLLNASINRSSGWLQSKKLLYGAKITGCNLHSFEFVFILLCDNYKNQILSKSVQLLSVSIKHLNHYFRFFRHRRTFGRRDRRTDGHCLINSLVIS